MHQPLLSMTPSVRRQEGNLCAARFVPVFMIASSLFSQPV
jgi:hypothetical protein